MVFFFFFWRQPKKYEPNALSPKAFFENFLLLFFLFFFYFWKFWKSWIFSRNWKFWLIDFFFLKQPKKYEPNAPSPKAFFENFLLLYFYFFKKFWKSWIFSRNWKFWLIFFLSNLRSTSPMPLVPRPFLKISFFFFFFFCEIWRFVHYQKIEEDIKLE